MAGSTVQIGLPAATAADVQTPNWKSCAGWVKPLAWSGLNPSCPVRTTVNPHPLVGVPPRAALLTEKVMKRVMSLAPICTDPTVAPPASMKRCPKPWTSMSRFQADPAAIA